MKNLCTLFVLLFISVNARAFPELVTHGYPNCVACHVSPSGGGTMSDYGRSLSKDLLSTWSYEGEEQFGHGLFGKTPEWLQVGGDLQFLQTYLNNPQITLTRNFWMDNEIEAAVRFGKFYLDTSVGIQRGPGGTPNLYDAISTRHYLGYYINDETSVRVGKFLPAYGLNLPNHTALTRGPLGFDQETERLNLEAAYMGEKYDLFVTALLGKADIQGAYKGATLDPSLDEKGAAVSSSAWIAEKFKVGASLLYASADAYHRFLGGVFGILKLSEKFYLLTEWDYQSKTKKTDDTEAHGFADYNELGFEAYKGVKLYLVEEESYLDTNGAAARLDTYGGGFKFYPRPHFEFVGEYRKQRDASFTSYYDSTFLTGHYYF